MKIVVSKIEAAQRQLREAIRIWFAEGDPVAVHSLVCSAHQIIHDLNSRQGGRDLLYDSLLVKDEFRDEWVRLLKEPYNFLKHGRRDADGSMELDTEATEIFILFSVLGLTLLRHKLESTEGAYMVYYLTNRPSLLTEAGKKHYAALLRGSLIRVEKQDFFKKYIAAEKRARTKT